jgi:hypothetical protein
MLFASPLWSLITADLQPPVPFAATKMGGSRADEKWNLFKNAREQVSDETQISKKKTYVACALWFNILESNVLLDREFQSSYVVQVDEGIQKTLTTSSAKWETLCLLARVIMLNLQEWVLSSKKEEPLARQCLKDAVACSRRAVKELKEWWANGNRAEWDKSTSINVAEANYHLFEAMRVLSELLFELTCLSAASSDEEVCAHDYNRVLLAVTTKAKGLSKEDDVPPAVEKFIDQVCAIVVIAVGDTVRECAERLQVLNPPQTIHWHDVCLLYKDAVAVLNRSNSLGFDQQSLDALGFDKSTLDENAIRLKRIAEYSCEENITQYAKLAPQPIPLVIEYAFPF